LLDKQVLTQRQVLHSRGVQLLTGIGLLLALSRYFLA
jgi:hypothetical protein